MGGNDKMATCANCGLSIADLGSSFVFNNFLVCGCCHEKLKSAQPVDSTNTFDNLEELSKVVANRANHLSLPKAAERDLQENTAALIPKITFTCPQCGATSTVPKYAKGSIRFCTQCGAANLNPAEKAAASMAFAEAAAPSEALHIYNEVLKNEPHNYHAWLGRGRSLGALATLENPTLVECIKAMQNATRFASQLERISLSRNIAGELESIGSRHNSIVVAMLNEYTNGQYNPGTAMQAWQIYCAACFQTIQVLEAAVGLDYENRIAVNGIIQICQNMLRGLECPVRNDVQSPAFVFGPLWFVATATILPELLKNGRVVLGVTPNQRATIQMLIARYTEILIPVPTTSVGSKHSPPPLPRRQSKLHAVSDSARKAAMRVPWWAWLAIFCIAVVIAATIIIVYST